MEKEIKINVMVDGKQIEPQSITNENGNIIIILKNKNKEQEMIEFIKPFLTNLRLVNNFENDYIDYYDENDNRIFRLYKNGYLWVTYNDIWFVFEDRFSLSYTEIQQFIKTQLEEYLFLKDVTPENDDEYLEYALEDLTPHGFWQPKSPM